jgi:4-amino-4-deoxy-L-arabinose transferase-like glycosyltransferase
MESVAKTTDSREWIWAKSTAVQVGAMALCGVIALWAQRSLDSREHIGVAWAAYGLAAVGFCWLVRSVRPERERAAGMQAEVVPRPRLLVAGLIVGCGSFFLFGGNRFTLWNVLPWTAGLALVFLALRKSSSGNTGRRAGFRHSPTSVMMVIPWEWVALAAVVALGAFFRFHQLATIPGEKWGDLGFHYGDVLSIQQGDYQIYFPRWGRGREPMFFYLLALYTRVFGFSSYATKVTSALIGLATVPALYLWARELFGREVGLYSAALLATSKWHVILSRSSFRVSLLPLFVSLVGYSLVRALRARGDRNAAKTGLLLGLSLYSYPSSLALPLAVGLSLAALVLVNRRAFGKQDLRKVAILIGVMVVALVPLARTVFANPPSYLDRGGIWVDGGLLGKKLASQNTWTMTRTLLDRFRRAILQFNYKGYYYGYYGIPHQRHMGFLDGILLVFGFVYSLAYWRRNYNVMLPVFLVMLLPPVLAAIASPDWATNSVRSSGAIGPAYVLAAVPLALLRRRLKALWPPEGWRVTVSIVSSALREARQYTMTLGGRYLLLLLMVGLFGVQARDTYLVYFRDYPQGVELGNYPLNLEMARAILGFENNGSAYIKVYPYWYDGWTVRAGLQDWDWDGEVIDLAPLAGGQGNVMVLVHPDDKEAQAALQSMFPRHAEVAHRDFQGRVAFVAFYGEGGQP